MRHERIRVLFREKSMLRRLTLCLALCAPLLSAQQTINNASVTGTIVDPSGAVIPNAPISARNSDTNVETRVVTGHDGRYRFAYLPIGRYWIQANAAGFGTGT